MRRRLLDTQVLISFWHRERRRTPPPHNPEDVEAWARKVISAHDTNAIATPVFLEFIAGVTSAEEMRLALSFLAPFKIIDEGNIPKADWEEAERIAKRVSRNTKRRQLGDCLIRAIANRLKYEVAPTGDKGFPRG